MRDSRKRLRERDSREKFKKEIKRERFKRERDSRERFERFEWERFLKKKEKKIIESLQLLQLSSIPLQISEFPGKMLEFSSLQSTQRLKLSKSKSKF